MSFEQATIKLEKDREFGALKAVVEQAFAEGRVVGFLKRIDRQGIRIRDWDKALANGVIDFAVGSDRGTALNLYQALTVSDQAQMREFYLFKVEQMDPALRARFSRLYQYY